MCVSVELHQENTFMNAYQVPSAKPVSAYLRPKVYNLLEKYRHEEGVNRSEAVKQIIEKYLSKPDRV